ncbi:unnamed protein product, partial [Sphacelaria rigidula]
MLVWRRLWGVGQPDEDESSGNAKDSEIPVVDMPDLLTLFVTDGVPKVACDIFHRHGDAVYVTHEASSCQTKKNPSSCGTLLVARPDLAHHIFSSSNYVQRFADE